MQSSHREWWQGKNLGFLYGSKHTAQSLDFVVAMDRQFQLFYGRQPKLKRFYFARNTDLAKDHRLMTPQMTSSNCEEP